MSKRKSETDPAIVEAHEGAARAETMAPPSEYIPIEVGDLARPWSWDDDGPVVEGIVRSMRSTTSSWEGRERKRLAITLEVTYETGESERVECYLPEMYEAPLRKTKDCKLRIERRGEGRDARYDCGYVPRTLATARAKMAARRFA